MDDGIKVTYRRPLETGYHGRHGVGIACGLMVEESYRNNERLCLMPVNNKGLHRSCYIDIHKDDVPALIMALDEMRRR